MANRKRNIQVKFYVTAEEKELMEQKMAQLQTKRIGAYLRKMAIDGYIIQVDTRDIRCRLGAAEENASVKPWLKCRNFSEASRPGARRTAWQSLSKR